MSEDDDDDAVVDVEAIIGEVDEIGIGVTWRLMDVVYIVVGDVWESALPAIVVVWLLLRTCCRIGAADAFVCVCNRSNVKQWSLTEPAKI